MRANTRRATGIAIAVGSFTAAMSLAGIGTAQAHGGGCGNVGIEHSVDGGHTWTKDGRINGDTPPTTIQVKLSSQPGKSCKYTVSLASYSTQGPDWGSSGTQAFRGWDTVTLSKGKTQATLDVTQYAPECFGQIDLYGNGTQYDGGTGKGHGALPHYPDTATPTNLITAWNGGHKCDETTPTPSDTPTTDAPTPSDTPTTDAPTPSDTPTTDAPTPSDTPTTDAPTPSDTPTVGDTTSPAPSTGSTVPPTGTPSVAPASSGDLAETGGNGTQTVAFAAGGAVLLLAGGAAVYFTRRRHSGTH